MKQRFSKCTKSILSFVLAAAMVMGLSGMTTLAADTAASDTEDAAQTQTILVRQQVNGTADTSFGYSIYRVEEAEDPIEEIPGDIIEDESGAGLSYTVYDAETDEALGDETTDENGGFSLSADEYAAFTLPAGTDWYVAQDAAASPALLDVAADGDYAYVVEDIYGVVQYESEEEPTPTSSVDKTALEEAIEKAETLGEDDYTPEAWEKLQDALEQAKKVLDDPDATQEEVDEALKNLEDAEADTKDAEPTEVDKTKLQDEYDADSKLSEDDYTSDSWKPFAEALEKAKEVLGNDDATQDDVDEALEDLRKAKEDLVKKSSDTPTGETTNITVTKTWDDNDDQDGKRPENVTVNLLADGSEVKEAAMAAGADGRWTYTFEDMPVQNDDGKEIAYTVTEDRVNGYEEPQITGDAEEGFAITNSCTPETMSLAINKEWDDNDNQDGKRPDSITVGIFAGDTYVDSKDITEADGWTCTFDDLPVYENGAEIQYTAYEFADEPYYTGTAEWTEDTCLFTNSYTPEQTSVSVAKVWNDADNQDGLRPDSVTVDLLADGAVVDTAQLSEDNDWSYDFTELDKYANGEEIAYTVAEDEVAGYEAEDPVRIDGTNQFILVNTHEPALYNGDGNMTVQKVWDDEDDSEGVRPEHIQVTVKADGEVVRQECVTEAEDWTCTFTDLSQYADGQEIEYTVEETLPASVPEDTYTSEITEADGSFTITNTHAPIINVPVTKVWDDNDNQDNVRPDEVTVTLLKDEEETGRTLTLSEDNQWTDTFEGVSECEDGEKITYTISEADVDGYEAAIEGDQNEGFTVTNTLTGEIDAIEVTKDWDEEDAYKGNIPASVEAALFANGEAALHTDGEAVEAITLTSDDWSGEFTNLPKYDANGVKIDYTVEETTEESLRFYTPEYIWDTDESVTITNHQKYFGLDEELVPDEDDRDSWVKSKSVNEYNAIEIEMATTLPNIGGEELVSGEYSIVFHDQLDSALVPDEDSADFKVTIDGNEIDPKYYTITLADGMSPASIQPLAVTIDDDCAFHVEVDLSALYDDGVITDEELQGDTELMLYFFADLEGTGLNGTYKSTAWYEVYGDGGVQYASEKDTVEVYTYEIQITKYDAAKLVGDDYDAVALAGATLGIYYDEDCTIPVSRNGESYTATSGTDGIVDFYGLAEGTYYIQETEAPAGYQTSDAVLTVVLDESLENRTYIGTYADSALYSPDEPNPDVDAGKIRVTKVWIDDGSIRPTSIDITLLANGTAEDTGTMSDAAGPLSRLFRNIASALRADAQTAEWTYTFENLPKYDENGSEIKYTVAEVTQTGYKSEITYSGDAEYVTDGTATITNTQLVNADDSDPTTTGVIQVSKIWEDNNNAYNTRPTSITVNLTDGTEVFDSTTLSEATEWSGSFTDVAAYDADGNAIDYTVSEEAVTTDDGESYTAEVTGSVADGFTVTNTLTGTLSDTLSVTKQWIDDGDHDGLRPDAITVTLCTEDESGEATPVEGPITATVTGGKTEDTWTGTLEVGTSLPRYDENGEEIAYTLTETGSDGDNLDVYAQTCTANKDETIGAITGFTLTNTHNDYTGDVTIKKDWADSPWLDLYEPDEVEVTLSAEDETTRTVELKADEGWKATLSDMHIVSGGDYIKYTLSDAVPGFTSTQGEITFAQDSEGKWVGNVGITNSVITTATDPDKENADPTKGEIAGPLTITKEWSDMPSSHDSVTVTVSSTNWKNGDTPVISEDVELSDSNSWAVTLSDLPAYQTDGTTRVQYAVIEDGVPGGYTSTVSGFVTNADKTQTMVTVTNELSEFGVEFHGTNVESDGAETATHGIDYTATLTPETYYDLPESIEVTIGGTIATIGEEYTYDPSTGELTIKGDYITGEIVITADATPKQYNVWLSESGSTEGDGFTVTDGTAGEKKATYNTDYTTTVTMGEGHENSTFAVTIGGTAATAGTEYMYNATTGELTINGEYITGDIVILRTAINYAVKVWGICSDTYSYNDGGTTDTASLTFGPAIGADHLTSYVSRETVGETAHPSTYCIHDMTWDEIIELCDENQGDEEKLTELFGSCLENGCTKAVELTPNETLFNTRTVSNYLGHENYIGDGVSTLYYLLNGAGSTSYTYGANWNQSSSGYSADDPANVYSRSRIRTTLTGDKSNIDEWREDNPSANDCYGYATLCEPSNCLLSCFPKNLQDAMVPRTTLNSGNATSGSYQDVDTKTTYDKLFLFSLKEIGLTYAYDDGGGNDYGVNSSDSDRIAYEFSGTTATSSSSHYWWSRSRYSNSNYLANYVLTSGSENCNQVDTGRGLSPGFCIGAGEAVAPSEYTVTFNGDNVSSNGASTATYGSDYTATLTAAAGYNLPESITVTIGGTTASSEAYTYDPATGELKIDGDYITGDIVITAVGEAAEENSTIILTLTDDNETASARVPLGGGVFVLYRVAAGGDDEEIGTYMTGEDGVITVEDLDYGEYYFVETDAPDGYLLPDDPKTQSVVISAETVKDNGGTFSVAVENKYVGSVKYAVKLWGICADTYSYDEGVSTETASLTFGPATGAEHLDNYVECSSETCIHKLSWDAIIAYCNQYQGNEEELTKLFGSCLKNGCTKAVELTPNETLFNMTTVNNYEENSSYTGDGVSTLYYLLNGTGSTSYTYGTNWNQSYTGYSADDPANLYSRSRIRATLTGDSADAKEQVASGKNDFYGTGTICDGTNCLLSCFPKNLQKAMVPRTTLNSGNATSGSYQNADTKTTYDKLFLFSSKETGITYVYDDGGGNDYGVNSSNSDRVAYEFSGTGAAASSSHYWWSRSRGSNNYYGACDVSNNGSYYSRTVTHASGLSPGFCIK